MRMPATAAWHVIPVDRRHTLVRVAESMSWSIIHFACSGQLVCASVCVFRPKIMVLHFLGQFLCGDRLLDVRLNSVVFGGSFILA